VSGGLWPGQKLLWTQEPPNLFLSRRLLASLEFGPWEPELWILQGQGFYLFRPERQVSQLA
jgi:hypothetical protein